MDMYLAILIFTWNAQIPNAIKFNMVYSRLPLFDVIHDGVDVVHVYKFIH